MDIIIKVMNFSTTNLTEYRDELFRTPLATERKLGLWVDRAGRNRRVGNMFPGLRKLGQYSIIAFESGSGTLQTRSQGNIPFNPGDAFIHLPEEPTRYFPDKMYIETWIVFNGPDTADFEHTGLLPNKTIVIKNAAHIVSSAYEKLSKIITSEDLPSIISRKIILLETINKLYQVQRKTDSHTQTLITRATDYIRQNATAKTSVSQLAQRCCLSETHFRRLFKQYTGRTPKDYILAAQISKAKQLLAQGISIKQTAMQIGCEDVCYFMRIFKKHTNQTAAQFQKQVSTQIN
jgi:AraC-like DNA-binding protein